jgi:probable F420-dependent oxidoreductase
MHIGLTIFPTDQTIDPVEVARESEARGFESLWFPEHSHIPASRETPWGGMAGAPPLPEFYWRTHDPFVALAACAAVTSEIKLATGICLVAQRDPIHTAKEVASLDRISGGRFLFGIGYGWNKEEMAHHGTKYGERRAILRENILAMKQLWTEDEASLDGDHVSFSSSWAWPKPTQEGGPPIVLGGNAGPRTAADIAEFCDGWMPIRGRYPLDAWEHVVAACEERGRNPDEITRGVFGAPTSEEKLTELAEMGLSRAVIVLPQGPRDEVMAKLDELAPLVAAMADA